MYKTTPPPKGVVSEDRDTELRKMMIAIRRNRLIMTADEQSMMDRLDRDWTYPFLTVCEAESIERIFVRIQTI